MRHLNPWVWAPVAFGLVVGATIGWIVTGLTCVPDSCLAAQIVGAVVTSLGAAAGIGVVVVLAIRSLQEWRESSGPPATGRDPRAPKDDPRD